MGNVKNLEEMREFFRNDRFATDNGMVIDEVAEDHVICSVVLGPGHKNANGGIMGGVIFTLADFAFAVLANGIIHNPTVAQQVSINYLGAPKGEKLFAKATCRKSGRSSTIINVDVSDETGRDVALFVGTGFKL
ncbi:MAG: PaaI family thioesterase [Lachnospiraceae bacterium]|nr:PaaI family thioesterase [Lachnospiraceae bacterium]MCR5767535.1 PaaI family thioesterase [Lachnospiraceae bacterium]